ncbi:hypothetical protein Fmac_013127 [Flemingia macrophylla]|uniref:ENTH domain-containing protein n=1 Tax=Flemingia macrophylla TaxID=520843 RepID=A0ABD1MS95_9FABA
MGTFQTLRKAYGALKDSTTVGLAKVNSEYKDLDIAIVKATSHVEYPPKERHVRKIFYATSAHQPRADVAYCIHTLAKRLLKTRNWIVAIKTLIVIHRILREGDPTFKEDLINYARRGRFLQISNFKDDSSPLAWDCSAWVRTYALFLEERLECYSVLKYDIEGERLIKLGSAKALTQGHSRTRTLTREELLEQLPALQQLLYRLVGCQPDGLALSNYLIQYALTLAEYLADFYEYCKRLDLARNFQFPTLKQPPATFVATMEEYIKEAPLTDIMRLEYHEDDQSPRKEEAEEPKESEEVQAEANEKPDEEVNEEEAEEKKEEEAELPPLISTDAIDDLLGLNEINPKAQELEENNALALAIVPSGGNNSSSLALTDLSGTSGWELALVTTPSHHTSQATDRKMAIDTVSHTSIAVEAGGFDKLLLDSLYEDENARRQLQLRNAGYGYGEMNIHNHFEHHNQQDPFATSNNITPPPNVQMAFMAQQQQQMMFQQHQQQMMFQQQQQYNIMVPYQYPQTHYPQQRPVVGSSNPFSDPLPTPSHPYSSMQNQGSYNLI